ncbi:hypothetical protein [Peredibacter starrii]|uniref:Lipoprotein n=1 Tax=Peredibacter starrii TaxID=28202 RepID=A0AAX4HNF4_9BACT|nr:hypothetical protein [Peredibacter starrii]WPU64825.1 hypothetical protein SOO65_19205 [Peredibacter starrii]
MTKALNIYLLFILISSCAHHSEARFQSLLSQGKCEEAARSLPNFKTHKVTEFGLTASDTTATIALSRSRLIYFVIDGIVIPTLSCMPAGPGFIGSASMYQKCFEKLHGASVPERFRCPDLSTEINQLNKVTQCYEKRGDVKKSREQRELLQDKNAFAGCLSELN